MSTQIILIGAITALGLTGVGLLADRLLKPPSIPDSTAQQPIVAPTNRPETTSAESSRPRSTSTQAPELAATLPADTPTAPLLPANDGTHYVHAIKLPFSVWDSTHQQIAVYINPQYPQYAVEVKQAFVAWQQALNHMFAFTFVADPEQSDVAINWADTLPTDGNHDDGVYTAGITKTTTNPQFIFCNDIDFRVKTPAQQPVSANSMYNTALHEIGHMLGIKGHSDKPQDIMTAVAELDSHRLSITHRDVNTLRYLYQSMVNAPRILTPPNIRLAVFRRHLDLVEKACASDQDPTTALSLIQKAIALYRHNPEAQLVLANLLLRQHRYEEAKAALSPWVEQPSAFQPAIYGKYVVAQIMQAQAYAQQNQADKARGEAKTALPKLSRALQMPQLDAALRQYLQEAQPRLAELAQA